MNFQNKFQFLLSLSIVEQHSLRRNLGINNTQHNQNMDLIKQRHHKISYQLIIQFTDSDTVICH